LTTMAVAAAVSTVSAQEVMKKLSDGTYVVNTTTLADDVDGYNAPTPVEVHIRKDRIVKVVPLKNIEGPKYFEAVKKELLPKYEGIQVKNFARTKLDGVTGATFTTNAIKENVSRGVDYYLKNKKKVK